MAKYFETLTSRIQNLIISRNGRPLAFSILLVLGLNNLISEWPLIFKPVVVTQLEKWTTASFKSGQRLLFDAYQRNTPRVPESQPVTIVAIDEQSLAKVGQWPWPRNRMAALINQINAMKPLAIGLDIYMPEADQTSPDIVARNLTSGSQSLATALKALPSHEAILANALQTAPTILGAAGFDHEAMTTADHLRTTPMRVHGTNPLKFVKHFDHVLASLPQLQQAAHGQAILSVTLEQGVVRKLPLVMSLGDNLVPGLPMEMLRLATQSDAIEIYAGESGIGQLGLAELMVPTQPNGEIFLHFAEAKSTADRYVSAWDIMNGKADPERFEGKLVLIGLTGAGLNDMRTTALGELVPGIEIQAQVIESIFDGKLLRRPPWLKWAETVFLFGFGLLTIWYVPRTKSHLATFLNKVPGAAAVIGLSLNMVIISAGFLVFKYFGVLLDAASIFIVSSATMGSLLGSAKMALSREKKLRLAEEQQTREREAYDAGLRAGLSKALD